MADEHTIYKVKANDFLFSFSDTEINEADIVEVSPTEFSLIKNNRSVNARLINADPTGKKMIIEIEAEVFHIEIKDELDQRLEQMGFNSSSGKQIMEVKAPMPGLVLEVTVADGQHVKNGARLLILEAMKMENSIMIHSDATIKKVMVVAGQAVEKGQVLVELNAD